MVEGYLWTPDEVLRASGETAPYRYRPSYSARYLVENDLIEGKIFDWGCGHGFDTAYFLSQDIEATGWDPVHNPDNHPDSFPSGYFQWIHCAFVLNTLPDTKSRVEILREMANFLPDNGYLALALRSACEVERKIKPTWKKFSDGYITSKGTFQRGFTIEETVEMLVPIFSEITQINRNPVMVIAKK